MTPPRLEPHFSIGRVGDPEGPAVRLLWLRPDHRPLQLVVVVAQHRSCNHPHLEVEEQSERRAADRVVPGPLRIFRRSGALIFTCTSRRRVA